MTWWLSGMTYQKWIKGLLTTYDASSQAIENSILPLPEGCHWTILRLRFLNDSFWEITMSQKDESWKWEISVMIKSQKSAEKKNFVWTGMEHDIVFPEFESLDIHYVRLHSTSISPRFHLDFTPISPHPLDPKVTRNCFIVIASVWKIGCFGTIFEINGPKRCKWAVVQKWTVMNRTGSPIYMRHVYPLLAFLIVHFHGPSIFSFLDRPIQTDCLIKNMTVHF